MGDPVLRERVIVLARVQVKLHTALTTASAEHGLDERDQADLTRSFMHAAAIHIDDLVGVYRGREAVLARVGEGLEKAGDVLISEPGTELTVADGVLAADGVSVAQMSLFYRHQERRIISRGLEVQAEGATQHPIIQRVLGLMYPTEIT